MQVLEHGERRATVKLPICWHVSYKTVHQPMAPRELPIDGVGIYPHARAYPRTEIFEECPIIGAHIEQPCSGQDASCCHPEPQPLDSSVNSVHSATLAISSEEPADWSSAPTRLTAFKCRPLSLTTRTISSSPLAEPLSQLRTSSGRPHQAFAVDTRARTDRDSNCKRDRPAEGDPTKGPGTSRSPL